MILFFGGFSIFFKWGGGVWIVAREKLGPRSENNMTYYQDDNVPHPGRAWDWDPHIGRQQLGDSPHPLRCKTSDKGKLKATLPDIKTQDENNRKLTRKHYNGPDAIVPKKTELEKFFKFNVIKSVPHAPWGAEIMRTTWVITEKTDNDWK